MMVGGGGRGGRGEGGRGVQLDALLLPATVVHGQIGRVLLSVLVQSHSLRAGERQRVAARRLVFSAGGLVFVFAQAELGVAGLGRELGDLVEPARVRLVVEGLVGTKRPPQRVQGGHLPPGVRHRRGREEGVGNAGKAIQRRRPLQATIPGLTVCLWLLGSLCGPPVSYPFQPTRCLLQDLQKLVGQLI